MVTCFLEGVRSHALKILSFKSAVSDKVLLARMYILTTMYGGA
jgi:hypothetical protein